MFHGVSRLRWPCTARVAVGVRRLDELMLEGEGGGFGAAAHAELAVEVLDVSFDGMHAEGHGFGHFAVLLALDDEAHDLSFAAREEIGAGDAVAKLIFDGGAKAVEGIDEGHELESRCGLVCGGQE